MQHCDARCECSVSQTARTCFPAKKIEQSGRKEGRSNIGQVSARRQTDRRNPISLLCDTEVVTRDSEKQEDGEVFRAVETPTNVDRVESVIISFDVHYVLLILPHVQSMSSSVFIS